MATSNIQKDIEAIENSDLEDILSHLSIKSTTKYEQFLAMEDFVT